MNMNNNYEARFSANLRRLRIGAQMTQAALARTLGYSEKTVSKWECADGIPGIATLYDIAALFRVSLDTLFAGDTLYLLGIDGGGTKTHLALAALPAPGEEITVLRELRCDCCNPIDIGITAAETVLRDAITKLADGIPYADIVLFAGIAGSTSAAMQPEFSRFFGEFGFAAYKNDTDNINIIEAGLGEYDGITLIMGTGICAFAKVGEKRHRVAGWGYLFDDGGCAYNIGRDALAAYFRTADGTDAPSLLTDMIRADHPEAQPLLGTLYDGGKKVIASYSRYVFRAAEARDGTAHTILQRNMEFAARVVSRAGAYFPSAQKQIPVILAGGITAQPMALTCLRQALEPERFALRTLPCAPVRGALLAARRLAESPEKG